MKNLRIFGEGFLEGFTMGGLRGCTRPAAADFLLAPEEKDSEAQVVTFAISEPDSGQVQVRGDLHQLDLNALDSMMMAIVAERNSRVAQEPLVSGAKG